MLCNAYHCLGNERVGLPVQASKHGLRKKEELFQKKIISYISNVINIMPTYGCARVEKMKLIILVHETENWT